MNHCQGKQLGAKWYFLAIAVAWCAGFVAYGVFAVPRRFTPNRVYHHVVNNGDGDYLFVSVEDFPPWSQSTYVRLKYDSSKSGLFVETWYVAYNLFSSYQTHDRISQPLSISTIGGAKELYYWGSSGWEKLCDISIIDGKMSFSCVAGGAAGQVSE